MSIASFPGMLEKTIILDGFSKTYAMTGWRMGYGVMPAWLVDAVNKLMVNSNSCTASFTQRAGIAALTGPQDGRRRWSPSSAAGATRSCRAEHAPGIPLPGAGRRVLRVPEYHGHGDVVQGAGGLLLNEAGVACLSGARSGSTATGISGSATRTRSRI